MIKQILLAKNFFWELFSIDLSNLSSQEIIALIISLGGGILIFNSILLKLGQETERRNPINWTYFLYGCLIIGGGIAFLSIFEYFFIPCNTLNVSILFPILFAALGSILVMLSSIEGFKNKTLIIKDDVNKRQLTFGVISYIVSIIILCLSSPLCPSKTTIENKLNQLAKNQYDETLKQQIKEYFEQKKIAVKREIKIKEKQFLELESFLNDLNSYKNNDSIKVIEIDGSCRINQIKFKQNIKSEIENKLNLLAKKRKQASLKKEIKDYFLDGAIIRLQSKNNSAQPRSNINTFLTELDYLEKTEYYKVVSIQVDSFTDKIKELAYEKIF